MTRLFFGAQVEAPWPHDYPDGRLIPEDTRHVTFAFIGESSLPKLLELLKTAPQPPFFIGPGGVGKELVFLSHVAALEVEWLNKPSTFNAYQNTFALWLKSNGYKLDERPFFPHITLARTPLDQEAWKQHFTPLPFYVKAFHLYQSMGNLTYKSVWEIPLLSPFEEFEHTADIAFHIRGSTIEQIHQNAQLALAFKFPRLIPFFTHPLKNSLKEIIISLNEMIGKADMEVGCPFKAVSFHGDIKADDKQLLHWEMIIDV